MGKASLYLRWNSKEALLTEYYEGIRRSHVLAARAQPAGGR